MEFIPRLIQHDITRALERNKSVLLLGPRQTGKTTLLRKWASDLSLSFVTSSVRLAYEKDADLLRKEVDALEQKNRKRPLVILDEVQKVPTIMDVVQDLIDRKKANFILTGSSARKLRRGSNVNLLPGRVVVLRLDPLMIKENPESLLLPHLLYGSLPGIVNESNLENKEKDLESYVTTYLEEEIRAEAVVRNVGMFARFLELAASESGHIMNFSKISQDVGVSYKTIASYYEILEDCLIAERIEPISSSKTRKKLTRTNKFLFYDMGLRRVAAQEGIQLPKDKLGHLFEQFIGLELLRQGRLSGHRFRLQFWRDPDGPEVDWVVSQKGVYIPIEVRWSNLPTEREARHLQVFLNEYANAEIGYIACQAKRKFKLADRIFAIPWQELFQLFES